MSINERFERHAHRTFAEAAARYLAEYQGKDRSRAEQSLDAVAPYVNHLRLIEVDDEAMQQFKEDRRNGTGTFAKPAMVGTINKDLTQIVTVLNKACRVWRWLPSAPQLVRVEGDARIPYPLTWSEQDRLFSSLPTGWDLCAAIFAINTGVRKSELFGLRWTDEVQIPELGSSVFILNRTKNGEKRAVICNSIARRAVDHMRKYQAKHGQSEFVFPSPLVRQSGKVYSDAWAKAGLPTGKMVKQGIHNLRHTFGHRLRAAGVPQEDRNALLGHARTNLAEHYALPDLSRLVAAAEKIVERRDTVVLRGVWESNSRPT